jgi:uncharacterized membrane protein YczE
LFLNLAYMQTIAQIGWSWRSGPLAISSVFMDALLIKAIVQQTRNPNVIGTLILAVIVAAGLLYATWITHPNETVADVFGALHITVVLLVVCRELFFAPRRDV